MHCNIGYSSTSSGMTNLLMDINCSIQFSFHDMSSLSGGWAIGISYLNVSLWSLCNRQEESGRYVAI